MRRTAMRVAAAAALVAVPAACGRTSPSGPRFTAAPVVALPGGAVFAGAAPARIVVRTEDLGVSPDGLVRVLVRAGFRDAAGKPVALLDGGDVDFATAAPGARVQWQTRMRFGGPAAIVAFDRPERATVTVRATVGVPLAPVRTIVDATRPPGPRVVAAALGPHLVQIGWAPAAATGVVRIRRDAGGGFVTLGLAAPPAASFPDRSVRPGRHYRYDVVLGDGTAVRAEVATPLEERGAPLAAVSGKAMWFSFSPDPRDPGAFTRIDPEAVAARAAAAGLRAIDLRVAYGAFREITPDARPTIDALLDAAARRGIAVVAWTVPRSTAFEDLAAAVAATRYRTARGTRFSALAVDLERGDAFLGDGPTGYAALTDYLPRLRAALGPRYPLIATVEDPFLEHLTVRDVPYPAIAASADALQPMVYWRMLGAHGATPAAARAALRGSYAATLRAAGRRVPIDLGAQSAGEGPGGAPSAAELVAAVREAKRLGALGITFFAWDGTSDDGFRALGSSPW